MKNLRGAAPKPENNDDCRVLAPFVMTLFDGEADETEARRARAHLLICQSCANRWLDWNRSRDLLRLAPVPAPPPQLLWRVLMACRLVGAPRRAATGRAADSNSATSRAAANAEVAAPANFSAQILARTTQAQTQSQSTPVPRAGFSSRLAFSPLKMSALALPALAAWMMVLQRDAWLPLPIAAPTAEVSPRPRPSDVPGQNRKSSAVSVSAPRIARRAALSAAISAMETAPSSTVPAVDSRPETANFEDDSATARPVLHSRNVAATALPGAPVMRAIEASLGLRASVDYQRAAPLEDWQEPQDAPVDVAENRDIAPRTAPRRAARMRLASLSNPKNAPHLRATRWQTAPFSSPTNAANSLSSRESSASARDGSSGPAAPQLLRVSLPSARAPQPARLLAENFDADDQRVEEIRSVVDDFRATLGPDDAAAEPAPGDGDGLG